MESGQIKEQKLLPVLPQLSSITKHNFFKDPIEFIEVHPVELGAPTFIPNTLQYKLHVYISVRHQQGIPRKNKKLNRHCLDMAIDTCRPCQVKELSYTYSYKDFWFLRMKIRRILGYCFVESQNQQIIENAFSCRGCGDIALYIFCHQHFPSDFVYKALRKLTFRSYGRPALDKKVQSALTRFLHNILQLVKHTQWAEHCAGCCRAGKLKQAFQQFLLGKIR